MGAQAVPAGGQGASPGCDGGGMAPRRTDLLAAARERSPKAGPAAYAVAVALLVLGLCGAIGVAVGQPLLFPSLAPTLLLFVQSPHQPTSAPRNVLVGHGVGLVLGFGALHLFGLADQPPASEAGLTAVRVVAAAGAVALTAVVLSLLKCQHPPAGTTTLLFALGVFSTPADAATVVAGIVLLAVVGVGLNRLLGVRQSLWAPEGEANA